MVGLLVISTGIGIGLSGLYPVALSVTGFDIWETPITSISLLVISFPMMSSMTKKPIVTSRYRNPGKWLPEVKNPSGSERNHSDRR